MLDGKEPAARLQERAIKVTLFALFAGFAIWKDVQAESPVPERIDLLIQLRMSA